MIIQDLFLKRTWHLLGRKFRGCLIIVFIILLNGWISKSTAQSNDDCFACHDDPSLTTERGGKEVSRYIPTGILDHSVHRDLECISCHTDADVEDFPHADTLKPVNCGECHDGRDGRFFKRNSWKCFQKRR